MQIQLRHSKYLSGTCNRHDIMNIGNQSGITAFCHPAISLYSIENYIISRQFHNILPRARLKLNIGDHCTKDNIHNDILNSHKSITTVNHNHDSFTENWNNPIKHDSISQGKSSSTHFKQFKQFQDGGCFKMSKYQYGWNSKMASKSNIAASMKCQLIQENTFIAWRQYQGNSYNTNWYDLTITRRE